MSFYASWSGLGRELPSIQELARFIVHGAPVTHGAPAASPIEEVALEHARHVGHLIEHWAAEHPAERLEISLSGHAQEIQTGVHSTLSLSLTTTPSQDPSKVEAGISEPTYVDPFRFHTRLRIDQGIGPDIDQEERTVDSSISGDPFAPEPERTASPSVAADTPEPQSTEEPALDPSPEPSPASESPGESAGPTEPEGEEAIAEEPEAAEEAEPGAAEAGSEPDGEPESAEAE